MTGCEHSKENKKIKINYVNYIFLGVFPCLGLFSSLVFSFVILFSLFYCFQVLFKSKELCVTCVSHEKFFIHWYRDRTRNCTWLWMQEKDCLVGKGQRFLKLIASHIVKLLNINTVKLLNINTVHNYITISTYPKHLAENRSLCVNDLDLQLCYLLKRNGSFLLLLKF